MFYRNVRFISHKRISIIPEWFDGILSVQAAHVVWFWFEIQRKCDSLMICLSCLDVRALIAGNEVLREAHK